MKLPFPGCRKQPAWRQADPGPTKSGPNLDQLRHQMEISRKITTPFDYWLFHYCGICTVSNAFIWNFPKRQQQLELSYFPKTKEWKMDLYHTTSPQPRFLSGCLINADPYSLLKPFVQRQKSTRTTRGKGTEGLCPHSGQVLRCSQLSCSFTPPETCSHQYLCRQRRKREEWKQRKKKTFQGINNPHYSVDCTSITKSPP